MTDHHTVSRLFTVNVLLGIGNLRARRFRSVAELLRRIHQAGKDREVIVSVCEVDQPFWTPSQVHALNLLLQAGRGLTYFRRNRPMSATVHTWQDLKTLVGVSTTTPTHAEESANQVPAGTAGASEGGEDSRLPQPWAERSQCQRTGTTGLHSGVFGQAGAASPRSRRAPSVSGCTQGTKMVPAGTVTG